MKTKLILILLISALLLGATVSLSAFAEDGVILPSHCYDLSTASTYFDFSASHNLEYSFTEGSHCTFTSLGEDPQLHLLPPVIGVNHAKYLCIEYKTDNAKSGEIFIAHKKGVNYSEEPESTLKWEWIADGEWHRMILYCEGWADVESTQFTGLRFDPLRTGPDSPTQTVDIRFFAFFTSEQKAEDFDFDAYREYVAQYGPQLPEDVTMPDDYWPDPEYVEMPVHPDDNDEGTLRFTYSDDGKYATISYGQGEHAVSYTVPNHEINLFGGYSGTDDLNRSLFDSTEVGVVTEDHDVGIVYYLWHGEHGDAGVFNIQQIMDQVGIEQASKPDCALWGAPGQWHFWNEPLYGYYYIDDNWVIRKHVELLMNAGIDFLCINATNGFAYADNALKLMAVLHDFNQMGFDAPQVVFYTNLNAQDCVQELYERIYQPGFYRDTWYMQEGKPLIIAPEAANIDDFFTLKQPQQPTDPPKTNAWPWMDFAWPQRVYVDADGNPSAINVSVAQHSVTARFSDSALLGNEQNRGRSFTGKVNDENTRADYYSKIKATPALYVQGLNFGAQWDRAIEADVPFVLVTGWNEWITQKQDDLSTVGFEGCASNEFSRDVEMMKGGYFDNYYMQLACNVQRLKGAAPVIVQDARNAVNVTGSFEVWDRVLVTYTDPAKDMLDRDAQGFGDMHYTNDTGRNDIVSAKVTADTKNVYFLVETREDITKPEPDTTWMQLLLSTGGDGWYGYDYIVNYEAKDNFTTTLARYNGTDGAYSFEIVDEISYRAKGNQMMIAVPLEMLGITNPSGIKFDFKWVDSDSKMTTMEQFYTEGDTAPLGRLNYTFQNCLDPDTAEQYVPSDQKAGAETSDKEEQTGGCKSVVGSAIILIGIATIPCLIFKKKRK